MGFKTSAQIFHNTKCFIRVSGLWAQKAYKTFSFFEIFELESQTTFLNTLRSLNVFEGLPKESPGKSRRGTAARRSTSKNSKKNTMCLTVFFEKQHKQIKTQHVLYKFRGLWAQKASKTLSFLKKIFELESQKPFINT